MSTQGKHILLVDDDPDIHDAVRLILEPLGCRLTCCTTAPEARAILRRERPDLLLLDIMLATPDEGLVLAKEIRGEQHLAQVPILIVSSIGEPPLLDGSAHGGGMPADIFLEKPLDPLRLRESVRTLLDRQAR